MHNKLLIRKLATEGLKMRRIKKVKCAAPGQEQKKIACPPSLFRTNVHKSGDSMQICHIFNPIAFPKPSVLHRPPTVFILRERCFMRIFRRAFISSSPFAQNFSTFGQNVSTFGEKCPAFSAPLHAALATRHKKKDCTPIHCTVLCLSIQTWSSVSAYFTWHAFTWLPQ